MNNLKEIGNTLRPILKLLISLLAAFFGASFSGILVGLVSALVILIGSMLIGNSASVIEIIVIAPLGALYLTGAFGVWVPLYSGFQIILFGIPTAFVIWRFKLIHLKTLIITGILLSGFPWVLIFSILIQLDRSMSDTQKLQYFMYTIGIGLLMGVCGAISGLCFWKTLQFLQFQTDQQTRDSIAIHEIPSA